MEAQLWDLFRETGEPMGYLLYRAEKNRKEEPKKTGKEQTAAGKTMRAASASE